MDNSLNTARAILVAGAAVVVIILLLTGRFLPALMLAIGIAAHAGLWIHLRRERRRQPQRPLPEPLPRR